MGSKTQKQLGLNFASRDDFRISLFCRRVGSLLFLSNSTNSRSSSGGAFAYEGEELRRLTPPPTRFSAGGERPKHHILERENLSNYTNGEWKICSVADDVADADGSGGAVADDVADDITKLSSSTEFAGVSLEQHQPHLHGDGGEESFHGARHGTLQCVRWTHGAMPGTWEVRAGE